MSGAAFERAFTMTMKHEGGYTKDGPTYMGIDRRFWPSWDGWILIDDWKAGIIDSVLRDTAAAPLVVDFYRVNFWDRIRGKELAKISEELACKVFDASVNCGIRKATKFLQIAINMLNMNGEKYNDIPVDGVLGGKTMQSLVGAIGESSDKLSLLLICYTGEQYRHYSSLSNHEECLGWFTRLKW